jgi:hypothetical protein
MQIGVHANWCQFYFSASENRTDTSLFFAVAGRWNPERAWDDRLGRLLAAVWVGFYLGASLLGMLP